MQINQTFPYMEYTTGSQLHNFQTFFMEWVTQLEFYLHQLLHILQSPDQQDESKHKQLIRLVMAHYHKYFLAKARVSSRNVFLIMSPPWLSSYERTFLWLSGFKPGLALHVVSKCGVELSSDQTERMERLTVDTKDHESVIAERLARLEQQVLAPSMLAMARMGGREVNGMIREADTAVERMAEHMEFLVGCADYLREKTVAKVVGILTTAQTVRFLAAMAQLQLRIRRWGQLREREIHGDANLS
ncbi:protein DOG1-like 4 [Lactuca sativa]|uniref:protein DOG1-like 4 n=1 Tax=Lactuca sativa TaxID=4236 RepID=UPI001C687B0B|nr:protein DOG1-like 4 [Lactuca sativa]